MFLQWLEEKTGHAFDGILTRFYITTYKAKLMEENYEVNTINKKIEDYTGKANTFKIGLIWDESPEFGDTLTITAIVTGLRFTDILGASRDMGNYIMIDKNYVFDKQEVAKGEGLSLYGSESSNIGFSSTSNVPIFSYSEDFPPVLSVRPGEDWSELSITPAIRRKK